MQDITNWMLQNILGPLMLPIFMLAILCMIAGARPEPIVGGFLSLLAAAITAVFRLLTTVIAALRPRSYPPRRYPPKPPRG
jgi:hypothetical protein